MSGLSFCYCPQCNYWVPADCMVYDSYRDEDTGLSVLTRACTACLFEAGVVDSPGFQRKEFNHQEPGSFTLANLAERGATRAPSTCSKKSVECIMCDSTNVTLIGTEKYKCNDCNEQFIL